MKYVLVPGSWLGGWAWKAVARRLREAGHDVYPVTLSGLGERVHLAHREIDLETHITDVMKLLEFEDLSGDVVLVAHSYAGFPVTGVVDRAGDRLSHVVYLDTAPVENGKTFLDYTGPEEAARMRRQVDEVGEGWRLPYPGFEKLGPPPMLEGLGPSERALLDTKATPMPFGIYQQPLRLTGGRRGSPRQVLISCNGFRFMEKAAPAMAGFLTPQWQRIEMQTGHWPMLSAPGEVADHLLRLRR